MSSKLDYFDGKDKEEAPTSASGYVNSPKTDNLITSPIARRSSSEVLRGQSDELPKVDGNPSLSSW